MGGDNSYKIQWHATSNLWVIDHAHGDAPYCARGRTDISIPLDATWARYGGNGMPPNPTVRSLQAIVVVTGAGHNDANGHYGRDGTTNGGKGVWTKEGDNNYKIQWSTKTNQWVIIDCVHGEALYCARGRSGISVPLDAIWARSGSNGKAPYPTVRPLQAIIVVSGAGHRDANGQYMLDGTTQGGREVWTKEGDNNYKIHWSTNSNQWVIDYVLGDAPYRVQGRDDISIPLDATWVRFQGNGRPPNPTVRLFQALRGGLPNQMLVELQLHLDRFHEEKHFMHLPYEVFRGSLDWPHLAERIERLRKATEAEIAMGDVQLTAATSAARHLKSLNFDAAQLIPAGFDSAQLEGVGFRKADLEAVLLDQSSAVGGARRCADAPPSGAATTAWHLSHGEDSMTSLVGFRKDS